MDHEHAYAMERCPSVHGAPTAQESNPAPWTVDPQGAGSVESLSFSGALRANAKAQQGHNV